MIEQPAELDKASKATLYTLSVAVIAALLGGTIWGINTLINGGVIHKPHGPAQACVYDVGATPEDACP